MPDVWVPGGARAEWGDRRDSPVRISFRLPVKTVPGGPEQRVRFTLGLPRALFRDFDAVAAAFEELGEALVRALPSLRAGREPVTIRQKAGTKIQFQRSDLRALRTWVELAGNQAGVYLGEVLRMHACADFVGVLVTTTPRGTTTPAARRVSLSLPAAFVAAHALVRDPKLRARVEGVLQTDDETRAYLQMVERLKWGRESGRAVALVQRAFRGVKGLPNLLDRNPTTVLREFRWREAGREIARVVREQRERAVFGPLLERNWAELYLGRPGAAAESFRLPTVP